MSNQAWVPGHATLFFAVPQDFKDPLHMGSLGAGINVDPGVITSVQGANRDQVFWNDKPIDGKVSIHALSILREHIDKKEHLKISHHSELLIGHGLSTSGAGAIGTLLASNEYFKSEVNRDELYNFAHITEVVNKTGLGSVVGQITSGIEIRLSQGGPNICKTLSLYEDRKIIFAFFAPLSTSSVLKSKEQVAKLTKSGIAAVKRVEDINSVNLVKLIRLSQDFMESSGLSTTNIQNARKQLFEIGEDLVTMAMIGETLVILPNDEKLVISWLENEGIHYCITQITNKKPHII